MSLSGCFYQLIYPLDIILDFGYQWSDVLFIPIKKVIIIS